MNKQSDSNNKNNTNNNQNPQNAKNSKDCKNNKPEMKAENNRFQCKKTSAVGYEQDR